MPDTELTVKYRGTRLFPLVESRSPKLSLLERLGARLLEELHHLALFALVLVLELLETVAETLDLLHARPGLIQGRNSGLRVDLRHSTQ